MDLTEIPVTDPQLPAPTPLWDALEAKVRTMLGEWEELWKASTPPEVEPPTVDRRDIEEATYEVLPGGTALLPLLVENPSLGDINLPLDWTDDNDLNVYDVLQGAIAAEMVERILEEED